MALSPEGDRAPKEEAAATRRQWHAPEFYFMDVGSTAGPHGIEPDNPGHEGNHS